MERTFISTGERIRNYLGVGLLLSLLLNAFVTPLYPDLTTPNTYVKPDVFSIIRAARMSTPPPKPTPPPSQRVSRHAHAAAKPLAINPPKTHGTSGPAEPVYLPPPNAVPGGIPGSSGTAPRSDATTDTSTTGPACANPNREASVIDPMVPNYPDSARDLGLGTVSVLVQVTIDAKGRLVDARVYGSSNNAAIDQAALRAARASTYAPRIANCAPVDGTYLFHADFEPN
jgi:TonB family protein